MADTPRPIHYKDDIIQGSSQFKKLYFQLRKELNELHTKAGSGDKRVSKYVSKIKSMIKDFNEKSSTYGYDENSYVASQIKEAQSILQAIKNAPTEKEAGDHIDDVEAAKKNKEQAQKEAQDTAKSDTEKLKEEVGGNAQGAAGAQPGEKNDTTTQDRDAQKQKEKEAQEAQRLEQEEQERAAQEVQDALDQKEKEEQERREQEEAERVAQEAEKQRKLDAFQTDFDSLKEAVSWLHRDNKVDSNKNIQSAIAAYKKVEGSEFQKELAVSSGVRTEGWADLEEMNTLILRAQDKQEVCLAAVQKMKDNEVEFWDDDWIHMDADNTRIDMNINMQMTDDQLFIAGDDLAGFRLEEAFEILTANKSFFELGTLAEAKQHLNEEGEGSQQSPEQITENMNKWEAARSEAGKTVGLFDTNGGEYEDMRQFSSGEFPNELGYAVFLDAMMQDFDDSEMGVSDEEWNLAKKGVQATRENLASLEKQLQDLEMAIEMDPGNENIQEWKSLRDRLSALYRSDMKVLAKVSGNLGNGYEEQKKFANPEVAAETVSKIIRYGSIENGLAYIEDLHDTVHDNWLKEDEAKAAYNALLSAASNELLTKINSSSETADKKLDYKMQLAKMITGRLEDNEANEVAGEFEDPEFAIDILEEVIGAPNLAMQYRENQEKKPNPLSQKISALQPSRLIGEAQAIKNPDGSPFITPEQVEILNRPTEGASVEELSEQYALTRLVQAALHNNANPEAPITLTQAEIQADIGDAISAYIDEGMKDMYEYLDGGWQGRSVGEFETETGVTMSEKQREAYGLLVDMKGLGYGNVSDRTWKNIGTGAKVTGLIVVGLVAAFATMPAGGSGGWAVLAGAAKAGVAMTAAEVLIFDRSMSAGQAAASFGVNAGSLATGMYFARAVQAGAVGVKGGRLTQMLGRMQNSGKVGRAGTFGLETGVDFGVGGGLETGRMMFEGMTGAEAIRLGFTDPTALMMLGLPVTLAAARNLPTRRNLLEGLHQKYPNKDLPTLAREIENGDLILSPRLTKLLKKAQQESELANGSTLDTPERMQNFEDTISGRLDAGEQPLVSIDGERYRVIGREAKEGFDGFTIRDTNGNERIFSPHSEGGFHHHVGIIDVPEPGAIRSMMDRRAGKEEGLVSELGQLDADIALLEQSGGSPQKLNELRFRRNMLETQMDHLSVAQMDTIANRVSISIGNMLSSISGKSFRDALPELQSIRKMLAGLGSMSSAAIKSVTDKIGPMLASVGDLKVRAWLKKCVGKLSSGLEARKISQQQKRLDKIGYGTLGEGDVLVRRDGSRAIVESVEGDVYICREVDIDGNRHEAVRYNKADTPDIASIEKDIQLNLKGRKFESVDEMKTFLEKQAVNGRVKINNDRWVSLDEVFKMLDDASVGGRADFVTRQGGLRAAVQDALDKRKRELEADLDDLIHRDNVDESDGGRGDSENTLIVNQDYWRKSNSADAAHGEIFSARQAQDFADSNPEFEGFKVGRQEIKMYYPARYTKAIQKVRGKMEEIERQLDTMFAEAGLTVKEKVSFMFVDGIRGHGGRNRIIMDPAELLSNPKRFLDTYIHERVHTIMSQNGMNPHNSGLVEGIAQAIPHMIRNGNRSLGPSSTPSFSPRYQDEIRFLIDGKASGKNILQKFLKDKGDDYSANYFYGEAFTTPFIEKFGLDKFVEVYGYMGLSKFQNLSPVDQLQTAMLDLGYSQRQVENIFNETVEVIMNPRRPNISGSYEMPLAA